MVRDLIKMVFKKCDLCETITNNLLKEIPDLSYEEFIVLNFKGRPIEEILKIINDKRIRHRSSLKKIISENKLKFLKLFSAGIKYVETERAKILSLTNNFKNISNTDVACYKSGESQFYKTICMKLNLKNNLKNRLRLYYHFKYLLKNKQYREPFAEDSDLAKIQHQPTRNDRDVSYSLLVGDLSVSRQYEDRLHTQTQASSNFSQHFVSNNDEIDYGDNNEIINIMPITYQSTPVDRREHFFDSSLSPILDNGLNHFHKVNDHPIHDSSTKIPNSDSIEEDIILPTPEKFNLPEIILNESCDESFAILPKYSENIDFLGKFQFKDCVHFEGSATIEPKIFKLLIKNE